MAARAPRVYITSPMFNSFVAHIFRAKGYNVESERKLRFTTRDQLLERVQGKHGILLTAFNKVDKNLLEAAGPQLKVIATASAGYDHIDLEECRRRNVKVGFSKAAYSKEVANLALALSVMVSRKLPMAESNARSGDWFSRGYYHPGLFSRGLSQTVAGIVGLGQIGYELLKRLKAMEFGRIIYCGNRRKVEGDKLGAEFVSFDELLHQSDTVFICCSLNDNTRKMFNAVTISRMKPQSNIINVARGALVDTDALVDALQRGHLNGAGMDVTDPEPIPVDHPLLRANNCIILPHVGGFNEQSMRSALLITADNIIAGLEGRQLPLQLV